MRGIDEQSVLRELCIAIVNRAVMDREGLSPSLNGSGAKNEKHMDYLRRDAVSFLRSEYCELICYVAHIPYEQIQDYLKRDAAVRKIRVIRK